MYGSTQSNSDAGAKQETPKPKPAASMSISAVLGASDPQNSNASDQSPTPSSSLPMVSKDDARSSFQPNGGNTNYTLPPMQFDGVDRRKQNLPMPRSESPPVRAEDAVARLKKNQESMMEAAAAAAAANNHHHHHHHHNKHHHHRHHHHHPTVYNNASSPGSTVEEEPPKTGHFEPSVSNEDVFDAVKTFPSKRLASLIYCELPPDGVLIPKYIDKENCTLEVRIPAVYLTPDNEAVKKRKLWGTEVYTDDSDLVAALYHNGHLKIDSVGSSGEERLEQDCIVTVRLLPRLREYRGSFRNGFNSRSWLTPHDGLSIYLDKVTFVGKGRADQLPAMKKQRINSWEQMRKETIELYPKVEADDAKVAEFRERYEKEYLNHKDKPDDEPKGGQISTPEKMEQ